MTSDSLVTLFPTEVRGSIKVPPSKSLSHRALICASLSRGRSTISNIVFSDDVKATLNALKHIGAKFELQDDKVIVHGIKRIKYDDEVIDCNESGSTLRVLIPLLSLTKKEIIYTGKQSLLKRPQTIYQELFTKDGNTFEVSRDKIMVNGSIKSNDYVIDGTVSSQFISGLLFALPLLEDDSTITINTRLESKSYVDLTVDILDFYGIDVQEIENGYFIPGNQKYQARDYSVEGDYSQSAYHLVAGTLNGVVNVSNLNHESKQGDSKIIDILKSFKSKIIFTENGFTSQLSKTKGTTVDISDCPDLGPIISLLGSLSEGQTKITNIARLRIKESDRVKSTVATLKALGADITVVNEEIIINGKDSLNGGVTVDSYNDHRIAMMISIASIRCTNEVILTRPMAVNKSYPHFYDDFKHIGGKFTIKE